MVLNEVNGNLGSETRVGLIVELLFSHFIQRIVIGMSTRIGIEFGIGKILESVYPYYKGQF